MKKSIIFAAAAAMLLSFSASAQSEWVYTDARTLPVFGKVCPDTFGPYTRLPQRLQGISREAIWKIGLDSAGQFIRFSSDAGSFNFRWTCAKLYKLDNMSLICTRGLALYVLDNGQWIWAGTARPKFNDKTAEYKISVSKLAGESHEYMLYLGLYDSITDVQIGVGEGCKVEAPKVNSPRAEKAVVIYGTSIMQGASASHPGLCSSNTLSRMLDRVVVNLGFSGNALLDLEIAELMAAYPDPSVYVIDNIPNGKPELYREKEEAFFRILRNAHPDVPVVFVENPIYPGMRYDKGREKFVTDKNETLREIVGGIIASGEKNIYYVPGEWLLPEDNVGTIEGTHFTDIGFRKYCEALYPLLSALTEGKKPARKYLFRK